MNTYMLMLYTRMNDRSTVYVVDIDLIVLESTLNMMERLEPLIQLSPNIVRFFRCNPSTQSDKFNCLAYCGGIKMIFYQFIIEDSTTRGRVINKHEEITFFAPENFEPVDVIFFKDNIIIHFTRINYNSFNHEQIIGLYSTASQYDKKSNSYFSESYMQSSLLLPESAVSSGSRSSKLHFQSSSRFILSYGPSVSGPLFSVYGLSPGSFKFATLSPSILASSHALLRSSYTLPPQRIDLAKMFTNPRKTHPKSYSFRWELYMLPNLLLGGILVYAEVKRMRILKSSVENRGGCERMEFVAVRVELGDELEEFKNRVGFEGVEEIVGAFEGFGMGKRKREFEAKKREEEERREFLYAL